MTSEIDDGGMREQGGLPSAPSPAWADALAREIAVLRLRLIVEPTDLAALLTDRLGPVVEALEGAALEFEDDRLRYVTVQINRQDWRGARAALARLERSCPPKE